MDFSLSYTSQFPLKWVRLDQITANLLIITIYVRDRSPDQTNKIFELSLKNGVRVIYNITSSHSLLPHFHFWKYFATVQIMNESMNHWMKKVTTFWMIKNKSYFVSTYKIEQLRQQLSNVYIFDNLTNKYKQLLSAHSNQIICE